MQLQKYLDSRNLSCKEFGSMIGVSGSAIAFYILGKRLPRLDIALKIVKATKGHVKLEDLVL